MEVPQSISRKIIHCTINHVIHPPCSDYAEARFSQIDDQYLQCVFRSRKATNVDEYSGGFDEYKGVY